MIQLQSAGSAIPVDLPRFPAGHASAKGQPTPHPGGTNMSEKHSTEPQNTQAHHQPRRRRWPWILLAVAVILIVMVLLLPIILSTSAGPNLIKTVVNPRIRGSISVEDMNVSWAGPTRLINLRAFDPQGREVLHVNEVVYSAGLWGLATSAMDFDTLDVDQPHAVAHVDEDGTVSLAQAFEPVEPSERDTPTPRVRGRMRVRSGQMRIMHARAMEQPYTIQNIDVDANFDSLNDISGTFSAQTHQQGLITGEFNARNLFPEDGLDLQRVSGDVLVRTAEPIDLAPLALALGRANMTGIVNLLLHARMDNGVGGGELDMEIANLSAAADDARPEPITVSLVGEFVADAEEIRGGANLSAAGEVITRFSWRNTDAPPLDADNIISAVMTGKNVAMPAFSLVADGQVDVARLSRAIPALMSIRPGTAIQRGQFVLRDVQASGGPQPSCTGVLALLNAAVLQNGQLSEWQDIEITLDGRVIEGTGLHLRHMIARAQWGLIEATGTPARMDSQYRIDLAGFQSQVTQVFDMGQTRLTGVIDGSAQVIRATDQRFDYRLDTNVTDFAYRDDQTHIEVQTGRIDQQGTIILEDNRFRGLDVAHTTLNLDDDLIIGAQGQLDQQQGAIEGTVNIQRVSVGYLDTLLTGFTAQTPRELGGSISGVARLHRPHAQSPLLSEGTVTIRDLRDRDAIIEPGDTVLKWTGLEYDLPSSLALEQASLTSASTNATASNFRYEPQPAMVLTGLVEASSDLRGVSRIVRGLAQVDLPEMAGQLNLTHTFAPAGVEGIIPVHGRMLVSGFVLGQGTQALREDEIDLVYAATIDPQRDILQLDQARLSSAIISTQARGTIEELSNRLVMNISGDYQGDWNRITTAIHQVAPDTRENIAMSGSSAGDFVITGPARDATVTPAFRGVEARTAVTWNSGRLYGIEIGPGRLDPSFSDGRLSVPDTQVSASDGVIRIGGIVDLTGEDTSYAHAGQLFVMEGVRVNPDMSREILSRVNPLFYRLAQVDGLASLEVSELFLPLSDAILERGSGSGVLDLSELTLQPLGPMALLVRMMGLSEGPQRVIPHPVQFAIERGRLAFREFRLDMGGQVLFFDGSVGFDDSVDMVVSVPVGAELLRSLGARGAVDDWAEVLDGVRISIPIVGTRDRPQLDTASVNIRPLIDQAVQTLIQQQLRERLAPRSAQDGQDDQPGPSLPPQRSEDEEEPRPSTQPADEDEAPQPDRRFPFPFLR